MKDPDLRRERLRLFGRIMYIVSNLVAMGLALFVIISIGIRHC